MPHKKVSEQLFFGVMVEFTQPIRHRSNARRLNDPPKVALTPFWTWTPVLSATQPRGQFERLDHPPGIRCPLPCAVVSRSVIDTGAHDGESE